MNHCLHVRKNACAYKSAPPVLFLKPLILIFGRKNATISINSLPPGKFYNPFLSSADFFQNQLFKKNHLGIPSECPEWIQIPKQMLDFLFNNVIFLFVTQPNHMLCVLKRTVYFEHPKHLLKLMQVLSKLMQIFS